MSAIAVAPEDALTATTSGGPSEGDVESPFPKRGLSAFKAAGKKVQNQNMVVETIKTASLKPRRVSTVGSAQHHATYTRKIQKAESKTLSDLKIKNPWAYSRRLARYHFDQLIVSTRVKIFFLFSLLFFFLATGWGLQLVGRWADGLTKQGAVLSFQDLWLAW